jgi:tRNA threonylcarbamoyladenosine biosynthesis protein TsaB
MSLIGFDTSLATTSACVLHGEGRASCTPPPEPARLFEPAAHSQELLPELERLVADSQTSWEEVESIAVGIGPGTFTGLRIGIATARALGQALGVGLRPVSSLEALAAGVAGESEGASDRPLLGLIDARRAQVFAALYRLTRPPRDSAPGIRPADRPALDRIWQPFVVGPAELLRRIDGLDPAPICVGDWAIKSRREIEDAGAYVPPSESGFHAVSALHLCRLAMSVKPVVPEDVYPVYLRLPDAEVSRRLARVQPDDTSDR